MDDVGYMWISILLDVCVCVLLKPYSMYTTLKMAEIALSIHMADYCCFHNTEGTVFISPSIWNERNHGRFMRTYAQSPNVGSYFEWMLSTEFCYIGPHTQNDEKRRKLHNNPQTHYVYA